MSSVFSSGNKELISQAKRSPILDESDFIPTYTEQLTAAFDSTYYRAGSGIDFKSAEMQDERNQDLYKKMREADYTEGQVMEVHHRLMKYNTDPSRLDPESESEINFQNILAAFPDVETDDEFQARVKARIKGELQTADKALSKSNAITAQLIGGFGGILTDPIVAGTMAIPFGGEFAIAKSGSVLAGILKASAIEGAIGAGAEVLSIPLQINNAAYLDEEFTVWDAAQNIALAGTGGFLLSGVALSGVNTFKYIKELRRGVDDASESIAKAVTSAKVGDVASVKLMEDFAYTAERSLGGDEFAPLYDVDITPQQYSKHMKEAQDGYKGVFEWGDFKPVDELVVAAPKKLADSVKISGDERVYSDILTESDRAMDKRLFDDFNKLDDADIPIGTRVGDDGETIIDTVSAKSAFKELDDEISSLEAIALCVRGSA